MVKCPDCEQEMLTAQGCTLTCLEAVVADKKPHAWRQVMYKRLRYGADGYTDDIEHRRCHDCGAQRNNIHHMGCDMERCPACKGQLISCGCFEAITPRDGGCANGR